MERYSNSGAGSKWKFTWPAISHTACARKKVQRPRWMASVSAWWTWPLWSQEKILARKASHWGTTLSPICTFFLFLVFLNVTSQKYDLVCMASTNLERKCGRVLTWTVIHICWTRSQPDRRGCSTFALFSDFCSTWFIVRKDVWSCLMFCTKRLLFQPKFDSHFLFEFGFRCIRSVLAVSQQIHAFTFFLSSKTKCTHVNNIDLCCFACKMYLVGILQVCSQYNK